MLTRSADIYYSTFYTDIAQWSDKYLRDIHYPNDVLFLTRLCDIYFTYLQSNIKKSNQDNIIKPLSGREIDALQYLAGYIIKKCLQKAKKNETKNIDIITILENLKDTNNSSHYLIDNLSRGGLTAVNMECQGFFILVENRFRKETQKQNIREINISKLKQTLMKNTLVVTYTEKIVDDFKTIINVEEIIENIFEQVYILE